MISITEQIEIEEGCGNVFRDLGLPNADQRLVKAELVCFIQDEIKKTGLTQKKVAEMFEILPTTVSSLKRGMFNQFSLAAVIGILGKLNHDVCITVSKEPRSDIKQPDLQVSFE